MNTIFRKILELSEGSISLPSAPPQIGAELEEARRIVNDVSEQLAVGTHAQYFNVSKERYAHYIAAAKWSMPNRVKILDIGNAPGHVAVCMEALGHDVVGVNLSAAWRDTYPIPNLYDRFQVIEHDIEKQALPFPEAEFDAIIFTEVLEHVAITPPEKLLTDFSRVLKHNGLIIFSTPNVCNISNIYSLIKGQNIFWEPSRFYGGLDRHNREFTPAEVSGLFREGGWKELALWGMSDHSNWRSGGGNQFAYDFIAEVGDNSPLLRNTIVGIFGSPRK
jgi:2-polyprenyl-3-methyl-5-hydroxy-6-metoxy-1,4-benzoquinol methylase